MKLFKTVKEQQKAYEARILISRRMSTLMRVNNIKQGELAELTGVGKSHVSKVLNCSESPGLDFLIIFCSVFNVSLSWLVSEKETDLKHCGVCKGLEGSVRNKIREYIEMVSLYTATTMPHNNRSFNGGGLNKSKR